MGQQSYKTLEESWPKRKQLNSNDALEKKIVCSNTLNKIIVTEITMEKLLTSIL
jgi:hypothetical protein